MGLSKYKTKRSFEKTSEPRGGKPSANALQFVVQKHDASHLHYDFRLELDGVLKSWAVPKGPSLNPEDKRLAMLVEDHPFDYKDFEGIIPKGNYGAGTVIVWDEGTYEPLDDPAKTKGTAKGTEKGFKPGATKTEQEKALKKAFRDGSLKFTLHGKKLKGEFALVKMKGRGENAWLLIKHRDKYATEEPVTEKDKSVLSQKNIEQVAGNAGSKKWISNRKATHATDALNASKITGTAKTKTPPKRNASSVAASVKKGKDPFPKDLSPMLATLVDKPFDEEGWVYEVKWDGYRALSYLRKGTAEIRSRNNKSFTERFYPVSAALKQWKVNAVVDGEIVVIDDKGLSQFNKLQNWRSEADGQLIYYIFDILWLDGTDLMGKPLTERKEILQSVAPADNDILRVSESFESGGKEFFAAAVKMGLEGIIAKKADSSYAPDARSREWLKIKTTSRQEVVIGGYTKNEGSDKSFSSLLVGVFEKGKLQYTGKIGTGFSVKAQKELLKLFKPLEQKKSPFTALPDINKPSRFRPDPPHAKAFWLKPKLLCEVSFREMTEDGVMRHPSFEGMREDKDPKKVVRERAAPTEELVKDSDPATMVTGKSADQSKNTGKSKNTEKTKNMKNPKNAGKPENTGKPKNTGKPPKVQTMLTPPAKGNDRKTLLNPADDTQTRDVNGHSLSFTHLAKIFWPKDKITKRDMLNYYYQVAPYILPYLKDRPQSLNRHPNGITGKSFYQKDVTGKIPDWIETFPYHSAQDERDKNFLVCTDEASLLYMVSLGCIELNPWSSRVAHPDNPDWCIIDLDPDKTTPFDKVIEAANVTRKLLDSIGVDSCCKTSGSTGLHVYFPLGGEYYTYEHSKEFARLIAQRVNAEIPSYTTLERTLSARKGRMYLDFLQNRPQATIAAPYSIRPKPGATVSTPLHWEEVKKGMRPQQFTIQTILPRLKSEGDLFKPVLGKAIHIEKALKKLQSL